MLVCAYSYDQHTIVMVDKEQSMLLLLPTLTGAIHSMAVVSIDSFNPRRSVISFCSMAVNVIYDTQNPNLPQTTSLSSAINGTR